MKYVKVILFVWIIAFSLLAAFYILALRPEAKTYKQYAGRLDKAVKRVEFLNRAKEMRLHQVLDDEISQMKKSLGEIILSESDLNMLDFRIHEISQECNLINFSSRVLTSKNTRGQEDSRDFENRRILVTFDSTFADFIAFVNKLERHDVAIFVDQFTINFESKEASNVGELYLDVLYTKGNETPQDEELTPEDVEPVDVDIENL